MTTSAIIFPFDLFGSGGSAAGARLIGDELREVLADNRRETAPSRARAYSAQVRLREVAFDRLDDFTHWRAAGRRLARRALERGDFLLWLAGNHLGALPVYDELSAMRENVLVVQLDAHLDIHQFRDTTAELSHGNFLLHCAGPLPTIVNLGHRDQLLTPEAIRRCYHTALPAAELARDPAGALGTVSALAASASRVYLDLDCDVFEPAAFPAVAEPVPFGLMPLDVLRIINAVGPNRLSGVMISELDPARDVGDRSLATILWLIEYLLLARYE